MEKDKRGGKREGAGRKPLGVQAKKQVAYSLDSRVIDILKAQPNQTAFLEKAVLEHQERLSEIRSRIWYKDRKGKLTYLDMFFRSDLLPNVGDILSFYQAREDAFIDVKISSKTITKVDSTYAVRYNARLGKEKLTS